VKCSIRGEEEHPVYIALKYFGTILCSKIYTKNEGRRGIFVMRLAIMAKMVNIRNTESAKEKEGGFYLIYLKNKENGK
jgi:hypothetical protein